MSFYLYLSRTIYNTYALTKPPHALLDVEHFWIDKKYKSQTPPKSECFICICSEHINMLCCSIKSQASLACEIPEAQNRKGTESGLTLAQSYVSTYWIEFHTHTPQCRLVNPDTRQAQYAPPPHSLCVRAWIYAPNRCEAKYSVRFT